MQYSYDAPSITGISPMRGPALGGTTVTISGVNFSGVTAVDSGARGDEPRPGSRWRRHARSRSRAGASNGMQYSYDAPSITGISPTHGPALGGTTVTISGVNLSGVTGVKFGSTPATGFAFKSDGQITATSPAGTGTVQVTVTTPSGTSNGMPYSYDAPSITSISPTHGPALGGTMVTISGVNLSGVTGVKFGSTPATGFSFKSDGQITATSPAGVGAASVTVTTPSGTSNGEQYTYDGPTLSTISPTHGPALGGTTVTISGLNLTGVTGVKFGSAPATKFTFNNDRQITATAPAGTGTVPVTVTTPSGTSNGAQYSYDAPSISSISPADGPAAGGTTVMITGTNFTGATAVNFGQTPATAFTFDNDGQITATSPAGSATVDITITTPSGTSATGPGDEFAYTGGSSSSGSGSTVVVGSVPAVAASLPTVGGSGVAFSGSVNPEGSLTTAYFEYGIDLSERGPGASTVLYDQTTPAAPVGADSSSHPVFTSVAGLQPNALYHVRLVASNGVGTTIGPDQTFTTAADPAPPAPVLGKAVNVVPVSGHVFILLPPGTSLGTAGDMSLVSKGQGFVPLTEARQIPTGSEIDALSGSLKMVSNNGKVGKTQTATLTGGVFKVTQDRTGITKGLDDFKLQEGAFLGAPTYGTCKAKHKATDATIAALSSKTLQLLKVSGHGKFKTTGRYSSATVRGTIYTVADKCNGTLTHVIRDTVLVDDFVRHTKILLRAGQSYLAKKP